MSDVSKYVPKPDRVFACVGKNPRGAVTEFRYGLEARLGLEIDFEIPILHAWTLPPSTSYMSTGGSIFLLSSVESSAAFYIPGDESSVESLDQEVTTFDLRYRTIAVQVYGNRAVQVTTNTILFIENNSR